MPTSPEPTAFGSLLKRLRLAAGLTQEALAERAGLSVRAISDLERGVNRTPHGDTLRLLTDGLRLRSANQAVPARGAAPVNFVRPAPGGVVHARMME